MGIRVAVGGRAVSPLRDHLAAQLDRKVSAHGLVGWSDPQREYAGVWSSIVPEGVRSEAFEGSWYELRGRIESVIGGEAPPKLVVYAPASPPEEDPLAEVRKASGNFERRLSTLVKQSLKQRFSAARIAEIARDARTFEQAEVAAEGAGEADVRLVGLLDATDPVGILVEVLTGTADERLDARAAWGAVADLARHVVGAPAPASSDEPLGVLFDPDEHQSPGQRLAESSDGLRLGLFQHLLFCDLARATDDTLPEALATVWTRPSARQQRTACEVLKRLTQRIDGLTAYRRLAAEVDNRLGLDTGLEWWPAVDGATGTPALEEANFRRSIELLGSGSYAETLALAERRLSLSPWASDLAAEWGSRWRAVEATARLQAELSSGCPPEDADSSRLLGWYVEQGWRVDRALRRLELARTEL